MKNIHWILLFIQLVAALLFSGFFIWYTATFSGLTYYYFVVGELKYWYVWLPLFIVVVVAWIRLTYSTKRG